MEHKTWNVVKIEKFLKDFKWFEKKRRNETIATMANFYAYWSTLKKVENPLLIKDGFVHPEVGGVIAIDQTGSQKVLGKKLKLAETRLYVYSDVETKKIYLIKMGEKKTQQEDIRFCREFLEELKGQSHG